MATIICTYTNKGYLPYIENLSKMCTFDWKLNVICLDQESVDFCKARNITYIPCFLDTKISNFTAYFDKDFNRLMFQKLDCIAYIFKLFPQIQHLIYLDGDVAVLKDFVPRILQYKQYDIVIQCDEAHMNKCSNIHACKTLCAGFMMLKNTPYVRDMMQYTKHVHTTKQYTTDQEYIIDVYHKKFKNILKLITVDRHEFPNGKFVDSVPENAYILHYNYLIGDKKQAVMRRNGHWK